MRTLLLLALSLCVASGAMAQDIESTGPHNIVIGDVKIIESHDITSTGLTIYPDDLGFIRETRTVDLPEGLVDIKFFGVSDQIIPETALLESFEGIRLEGNFDSDLISPEKLIEKSVGQTLTMRRLNPGTGISEFVRAKLISAAPNKNNSMSAIFSTAEGVEAYRLSLIHI